MIFAIDVVSHLNDLDIKLRGKDKLIPRLINDIIYIFEMKFKPFVFQLKSLDFSKFPQLKEQSECAEDFSNFTEYIENIILIQQAFESCFGDFAKEEDCTCIYKSIFTY